MGSMILYGRLIFDIKEDSVQSKNIKEILSSFINPDFKINQLINKGNKKYLIEDVKWRFGGIKKDTLKEEEYIYGKLGKESAQVKLAFDDKTKDYIESKSTEAHVMHFLIDMKRKVIAYESKKYIGDKAPIELFEEITRLFYSGDIILRIKTITDKRLIIDRMKKLSILNTIDLNVYRTNPDSTSGSDSMDRFLREGHIKKLKMHAIGDERGIQLDKVQLIKSGFHLAEEGYGSAKAGGKIGVKKDSFSVGDVPMKSEVTLSSDDSRNIQILLYQIKEILRKMEANQNNNKKGLENV